MMNGEIEVVYRGIELVIPFEYEPGEHLSFDVLVKEDGMQYPTSQNEEDFFYQMVEREATDMLADLADSRSIH